MSRQVWLCGTCGGQFDTEAEADNCATDHPDPNKFKISRVNWMPVRDASGHTYPEARRVPHRITIKLSDQMGDFASYKLDHVGMKGL